MIVDRVDAFNFESTIQAMVDPRTDQYTEKQLDMECVMQIKTVEEATENFKEMYRLHQIVGSGVEEYKKIFPEKRKLFLRQTIINWLKTHDKVDFYNSHFKKFLVR